MTHASVFSGIGGPEVAATMLGWTNLFHCEINPFGRAVLEYWYPNSKSYEDITKTDFSEWRGKVNVLTGGFPCQPFSYAGKRGGAKDDRYLWPYMHKCIQQVKPDWVVCENVSGITSMVEQGNVSEMAGEAELFAEGDGLRRYQLRETFTLERISNDLESDGYSVQAVVIPACAVSAPHRRDRVFIVGCRNGKQLVENALRMGCKGGDAEQGGKRNIGNTCAGDNEWICGEESGITSANPTNAGLQHGNQSGSEESEVGTIQGEGSDTIGNVHVTPNGNRGNTTDTCRTGLERKDEPRSSEAGEWLHLRGNATRYDKPIIANTNSVGFHGWNGCNTERHGEAESGFSKTSNGCNYQSEPIGGGKEDRELDNENGQRNVADTRSGGLQETRSQQPTATIRRNGLRDGEWNEINEGSAEVAGCGRWANFPTVSPVHRGNDGLPFDVDDLTIPFSKWRTESLKAYGNAIVVQVMYEIFRAIQIVEENGTMERDKRL